ncbi:MAG TPA: hypothetical protein VFS60_05325 [Thermoanaerobaculia bacterium]|nr:hypothetical protein [Thermoanaerobaculia bacterium]
MGEAIGCTLWVLLFLCGPFFGLVALEAVIGWAAHLVLKRARSISITAGERTCMALSRGVDPVWMALPMGGLVISGILKAAWENRHIHPLVCWPLILVLGTFAIGIVMFLPIDVWNLVRRAIVLAKIEEEKNRLPPADDAPTVFIVHSDRTPGERELYGALVVELQRRGLRAVQYSDFQWPLVTMEMRMTHGGGVAVPRFREVPEVVLGGDLNVVLVAGTVVGAMAAELEVLRQSRRPVILALLNGAEDDELGLAIYRTVEVVWPSAQCDAVVAIADEVVAWSKSRQTEPESERTQPPQPSP